MWFVYALLFILAIAAAAAAVALYLGYAAASALVAAGFAVAAYSLGLPVAYLTAITEVLVIRPTGLSTPARWPQPPEDADPAVLQYFYGPAMADAWHGMAVAYRHGQAMWRYGADAVGSAMGADLLVATVPPGIGGAAGMAVGTAAGAVLAAGCALLHLLVVALSTAGVRATGAVLRVADSVLLRIKNIRIVCKHCGERVPYPGYMCPGEKCERRHQDVRPGRYGVIRRYCRCGMRMKTLLLLGSARMAAFCPYCGQSLDYGPGEAPEIVLPFIGAVGAGKTRLLSAMVTQLMTWGRAGHLSAEPGDKETAVSLDKAEQLLSSGRAAAPTSVELPRSLVVRVSSGRVTRILHLFDAPGERFRDAERTEELRYLREARTFILVIDPLSVAASWSHQPDRGPAESTVPSPDHPYHLTYQQIEAMGVRLSEARLAVAFSRADLMETSDCDVAEWACRELGLSNLVISARQNFKEARFFRTAAVAAQCTASRPETAVDGSIAVLLDWVLVGSRLAIPGGDDGRSG
jgi:Double-GTPase 2